MHSVQMVSLKILEAEVKICLKNIKGSLEALFIICKHNGLKQLFNFQAWCGICKSDCEVTTKIQV